MKEIQIIQFHQGVNLHIFNFSHKHWPSRSWGTADHRSELGANQTEEWIHSWCLIRCRTPRTRSFFPTSTLCLPRPESIGLSTPDPVPSEPPSLLLSSTHVTSSSSSLWLRVPKHKIVLTQLPQQEGQVLADVTHGWLWLSSNQQNWSVKHLWKLTWKTRLERGLPNPSAIAIIVENVSEFLPIYTAAQRTATFVAKTNHTSIFVSFVPRLNLKKVLFLKTCAFVLSYSIMNCDLRQLWFCHFVSEAMQTWTLHIYLVIILQISHIYHSTSCTPALIIQAG